ncbi:4549_t:CDS:2, partial [Acaulospora colombiana]
PRTSSIGWDKNLSPNSATSQTNEHDFQSSASPNADTGLTIDIQQQRLKYSSPKSPAKNLPPRKKNLLATIDGSSFQVVNITGLEEPGCIKDMIFSKFGNIDRDSYSFHVMQVGEEEIGPMIDDNELVK